MSARRDPGGAEARCGVGHECALARGVVSGRALARMLGAVSLCAAGRVLQADPPRVPQPAKDARGSAMAPRAMAPLLLLAMVQGLVGFTVPGTVKFALRRQSLLPLYTTGRRQGALNLLRNQLNTRDTAFQQHVQVRGNVSPRRSRPAPAPRPRRRIPRTDLAVARSLRVSPTTSLLAQSTPRGRASRFHPPPPAVHLRRARSSSCRPRSTSAP